MPRRRRFGILLAVTVGHALVIGALELSSRMDVEREENITTLVFLELPPPPPPLPTPLPPTVPPPTVQAPPPTRPQAREPRPRLMQEPPRRTPPTPVPEAATPPIAAATTTPSRDRPMVAVEAAPRIGTPLRLYAEDGSLALPDDVIARLEDVTSDKREFDFQMPGLMESGTFMDRQVALVYEPTRFDAYWRPNHDVLSELLEAAVEKTTKSIEIPIPGSPGSKIVCTVSVLAMGGGCGIVNNNDGYVPQLDDPDTLNPEEEKQCKAWWEQIVAANGQDAWRQTRALYEASCRKPPEVVTDPP